MDIGRVLATMPPIVENIFIHLNRRDLDSASAVCDLWSRVGETEKNRRGDLFWFFQGLHCSVHDKIHSSCRECSLDMAKDIEDEMRLKLTNLKSKPAVCLTFATNYLINDFERLFPSFEYPSFSQTKRFRTGNFKQEDILRRRAYLKTAVQTAVRQYLPEQCQTIFCVAPGVVGSFHPDYAPIEIEDGYAISGLMIPTCPGLEVYSFPIDEKKCDISKLIPESSNIKCLLVFVTPYDSSCYSKIIQSCLLREKSKIAIAGAVVDRSESHCGSVIAFCGESVEAATVIIKPTDKEAELEKKLKRFQETGLLEDRCFAFMFACVARGFFIYREYNLESSVFRRLYPSVPLVGIFGNGEIGIEYFPNAPIENPVIRIGKLARPRKRFLHSYTTVFVLISVKL